MIKLTTSEFERKYGVILNYAYISIIKKYFLNTSKGAWLFIDPNGLLREDIFDLVRDYKSSQASPRRCSCREYSCHKCHLDASFYLLKTSKYGIITNYSVYTYMEVYKDLVKKGSPSKILDFKRTIMEISDEQF